MIRLGEMSPYCSVQFIRRSDTVIMFNKPLFDLIHGLAYIEFATESAGDAINQVIAVAGDVCHGRLGVA